MHLRILSAFSVACTLLLASATPTTSLGASSSNGDQGAASSSFPTFAARQAYDAAIAKGCSRAWALRAADSTSMQPNLARPWLNYIAGHWLHDATENASSAGTRDPKEAEAAARDALNDWNCGAATRDDSSLFAIMLDLGDALEKQQKFHEAETAYRSALSFAERNLGKSQQGQAFAGLAQNLESQGRYADAQSAHDEARALHSNSRETATNDERVRELGLDALISLKTVDSYTELGMPLDAEDAARRALDMAARRDVPDDQVTATILLRLASLLDDQNEYAEEERILQRVLPVAGDAQLDAQERLAQLRVDQKRFVEAEGAINALLNDARRVGDDVRLLVAVHALGKCYEAEGRYSDAESQYRTELSMIEKSGGAQTTLHTQALYDVARILRAQGRYSEAEPLDRTLLASSETAAGITGGELPEQFFGAKISNPMGISAPEFVNYAGTASYLATDLIGLSRFSQAKPLLERALEVTDRQIALQKQVEPDDGQIVIRNIRLLAARRLVDVLWALGPQIGPSTEYLDEAFGAAQTANENATAGALARAGARILASAKNAGPYVQAHDEYVQKLRALDTEDLDAESRGDTEALEAHARLTSDRAALVQKFHGVYERLREQFPAYWDLLDPSPVTLSELQGSDSKSGLLHDDEVLIQIVQNETAVYVFAATRQTAAWVKAPIAPDQLAMRVAQLRCQLDAVECQDGTRQEPVKAFNRQTAYNLYQALLGQEPIAHVFSSKRKVIFVANGAMTALPLGALVTAPPDGNDDNPLSIRETGWLIKGKSISVLPAVSSLRTLRRIIASNAEEAPEPFLGFAPAFGGGPGSNRGLPENSQTYFIDGRVLIEKIRDLPALSNATEVESMRTALGAPESSIFVGAAASKEEVLDLNDQGRLKQARVLAFSTHGLVSGDFGLGEPALALAPPAQLPAQNPQRNDGLLRASDVATLEINADWVVLSACNTGAGATPEADGLSGLARAFFYAGARGLLVSHWRVRDTAATFLTIRTIEYQKGQPSLSRAEALRKAQLELMNNTSMDDTTAPFSQPSAWAAFVIVGSE